ncbi:MAG: hypothetical protein H6865_06755 [Rhodospirillales bacterium]|nr:hypothetical protein [Rhodospirillales bacterium]
MHYLWITPFSVRKNKDGLCAIPLEAVDMAVINANLYKSADFTLWYDRDFVNDATLFWLGSFVHAMSVHDNLRLRNLREIPTYAGNGLFNKEDRSIPGGRAGNLYSRADLARVLVLQHHMNTQEADRQPRFVVYSDIDCPDLQLGWAVRAMSMGGLVANDMGDAVSHGYIGLDTHHCGLRKIFDECVSATEIRAQEWGVGSLPFETFWERAPVFNKETGERGQSRRLLPPIGYRISRPEWIENLGVCPNPRGLHGIGGGGNLIGL